jgi:hypothetical protein
MKRSHAIVADHPVRLNVGLARHVVEVAHA